VKEEWPGRKVYLEAYFIDRTEVTVFDYAECVMAGGCSDRRVDGFADDKGVFAVSTRCNWKQPNREQHPINCVSHEQAGGFCRWRGARLPTEAEWERAARSTDKRDFPWGRGPGSCVQAVMAQQGDEGCGRGSSWPVASKAGDFSPDGTFDMAGNVREWVSDWYDPEFYRGGPTRGPMGPAEGELRVARGGSWGDIEGARLRTTARQGMKPSTRSPFLGFRCARAADD
jgi:iron(II)-dependent oxidoreductase